ncbi:HNH endonuclease [Roseateles oligotrophus]|uniref:HNH endonuclease n=1 Tax=Roseateles oligotrophus TaxID=1769250 RepID=A0ABT2YCA7_9BURK|nr:HNH endonuclease [Roseateles oligotrophus]MCV2367679.1 HNH endonuclease [Roseateles oligotrophus]
MLLAMLDLARSGALTENRIIFAPPLLERYASYFKAVAGPADHANPFFPFFHLTGRLRNGAAAFWHLQALPGRESVIEAMASARSSSAITDNIAYAYLDQELFELLRLPANIECLADALSTAWFDRGLNELKSIAARCGDISRYERQLRMEPELVARSPAPPACIRDPAFRRVVTQLYDYRCAATGVRLLLEDGTALVEAAHIHPFSEGQDDDPRNGLALTPNMHWAMDQNLIAPGPDYLWHVSRLLDHRIPDYRMLVDLQGHRLLLPVDARMYPKREALEWRLERLLTASGNQLQFDH